MEYISWLCRPNILGTICFFGVGGYASAVLLVKFGIYPWIGLFASISASMALGWLIGVPCFRLKGRYFAIATMAVVQIVYLIVTRWEYVGGARGIYFPLRNWGLAHFAFRAKEPYYLIAMGMMLVAMVVVYYIEYSHIGYYLKTIREDPDTMFLLSVPIVLIAIMGGVGSLLGPWLAQRS